MNKISKAQILSDDQLLNHVFGQIAPLQAVLVGLVLMCSHADRERLVVLSASAHAFADVFTGGPMLMPKVNMVRMAGLVTVAVFLGFGLSAWLANMPPENPPAAPSSHSASSSPTFPVRSSSQQQQFVPSAMGQPECRPCHDEAKASAVHSSKPSSYRSLFPTVPKRNSHK